MVLACWGAGRNAGAAQAEVVQQAPSAPALSSPAPLTLSAATAEALAANPAARAASQQLAQAQARLTQAQAQRRFQITFNSMVSGSNADVYQPPPRHETFGTMQNTLTVPVPIGPKYRLAIEQAQAELVAAQAQYRGALLALAAQVSSTYFDVLQQQALLAIAQETLAQAQRQLADAQKRYNAGDVAQLDVLRAQVPVASAQARLAQAQNAVAIAQQTVNGVLGRPPDMPLTLAPVGPMAATIPYTPEQARALALQSSPDVRAAEATVRADQAALESARRYREPGLSLQAIDIRSGDLTGFSREDTLQAAVTLPLSDGGLGRARVQEARAALAGARAQVDVARRGVLVGVSAAYLKAQGSQRQVQAAAVAQDAAQVSYNQTVRGYEDGLFPLVDVLNAQAALTEARIAYTQAVYGAATAVSALNATVNGSIPGASPGTPGPGATPSPSGTSPTGASSPGTGSSGP